VQDETHLVGERQLCGRRPGGFCAA
jgi:hypothetical protein